MDFSSVLPLLLGAVACAYVAFYLLYLSPSAKERIARQQRIAELPIDLLSPQPASALLGFERELHVNVYLPDSIRSRHVHILGATGSGKTESVVFGLLRQDIARSYPSVILDAKGDESFFQFLRNTVLPERLLVLDISNPALASYCPLKNGSATEAAQRLFNSISWTQEEFYRSRCKFALFSLVSNFFEANKHNPSLVDLASMLRTPERFLHSMKAGAESRKRTLALYDQITGLKDSIEALVMGERAALFDSKRSDAPNIDLRAAIAAGKVIYFRLPSLLDAEIVPAMGKLIINDLKFIASQSHLGRSERLAAFCPIFMDEFANFVCPQFLDFISMARSAGFALHFSHQSLGDFAQMENGEQTRILDNASTKIVLRSYDADTTDYLARTLGTVDDNKITHRVEVDGSTTELMGAGSLRAVQRFRASPNAIKRLPTGHGFVSIAHGEQGSARATDVFELAFPRYFSIPQTSEEKAHA